ncbi:hypothetical protein H5P28_04205 [Ruficoccus amylovorans]|uniref:Uncharacterized protein n=1 Tax=Ruficoccus amylovorans TaxID=1804625 RepID=A0A842HCY8_9BACT|nr:hypothetical protein [Ruficoccus amylovorans]MBC2593457.1 hypothetical protein [Ruficoccus amylovorans]
MVLMGFVFILIMAFSGLVMVESSSVRIALDQAVARQNAMLGMQVAIGRLQSLAGPDRRITAKAGIFMTGPGDTSIDEPDWVGVWSTNPLSDDGDESTYDPVLGTSAQRSWDSYSPAQKMNMSKGWLVSGAVDTLDPSEALTGTDVVTIRKAAGDARAVKVYFEDVEGQPGARYAWWVQDENQKVRIDMGDPYRNAAEDADAALAARVAQRFAPEVVLPSSGTAASVSEDDWARISSLTDLAVFGIDPEGVEDFLSASSVGVLTDPRVGGLKKDLTSLIRLPEINMDDGVTADLEEFPEPYRTSPYLYSIYLDEEIESGAPTNPNVGVMDNVIYGPRIEALWDFANHRRLLSGANNTIRVHEPVNEDWLATESGTDPNGYDVREEIASALLNSQPFVMGDERENDIFTPYEAQALGDLLNFGANFQDYDVLDAKRHLPINSPVTPIMTELIFYVRAEVVANGSDREIQLHVHPFVELTNPYDVPVLMDKAFHIPVFQLRMTFDFRLSDADPGIPDLIWSVDNDTSQIALTQANARSLGSMITGELKGGSGSEVTTNANMTLRVAAGSSGISFAPGETKGFVASSSAGGTLVMVEGDDWRNTSMAVPVRSYSRSGSTVSYGLTWPQFSSGGTSGASTSMDDYNLMNIRVSLLPMMQQGAQRITSDWHTQGGSQLGNIRLTHQAVEVPFSRNRIGENSQVGTDSDLGDAFAVDVSLVKDAASTWGGQITDVGVIQLRALSAEDFRLGTYAVDGLNDGAENFLGRTNPRSLLIRDPNGFDGDRAFETSGWTTGFYPDPYSFGLDMTGWGESNVSVDETILFHVPQEEPSSLGVLRHWNVAFHPGDPAYTFGSSRLPSANLERTETVSFHRNQPGYSLDSGNLTDFDFFGQALPESVNMNTTDLVVDSAYYLNRALWDSYFFSTVPAGADLFTRSWPNQNFVILDQDEVELRDHALAAKHLMLKGAFNVNSTSEKAWAAFLASRLGLTPEGRLGASDEVFFPRMPGMQAGTDEWAETRPVAVEDIYRSNQSDSAALETLSEYIVDEVRQRGPFLSVAQFVNRMLVDDERGDRGALQAAIERSGLNADSTFAYAPGTLTQGDLLEPLGPYLSVRGDTFTIRSIGEVTNPISGETAIACCEAIVQRTPEYIDPANLPEVHPSSAELEEINRQFGRKFRIIGFRWLDTSSISL